MKKIYIDNKTYETREVKEAKKRLNDMQKTAHKKHKKLDIFKYLDIESV